MQGVPSHSFPVSGERDEKVHVLLSWFMRSEDETISKFYLKTIWDGI